MIVVQPSHWGLKGLKSLKSPENTGCRILHLKGAENTGCRILHLKGLKFEGFEGFEGFEEFWNGYSCWVSEFPYRE